MFTSPEEVTTQAVLDMVESIPEENLLEGSFTDSDKIDHKHPENHKGCILGQIGVRLGAPLHKIWSAKNFFRLRSYEFLRTVKDSRMNIASINNDSTLLYPQESAKERLIACLKEMIEAGYN